MYFGLLDADSRICLDAWKIASENADDLAPCLRAVQSKFGTPREVLHDLGDAMAAGYDAAWNGAVPHRVASSTCSATSARTCTRGPRRRSGNLSAS